MFDAKQLIRINIQYLPNHTNKSVINYIQTKVTPNLIYICSGESRQTTLLLGIL